MRYRTWPGRFLLITAGLGACGEQAETSVAGGAGVAERDSAGVHIVETASAASASQWRISDAPRVSIGVVEGAPEYTLHRVSSARVLSDGRIVVVNGGNELRFYSPEGVHIRTVGRKGAGPGEYRDIAGLVVSGDTLFVYDADNNRISLIATSGEFLRSEPIQRVYPLVGTLASLEAVTPAGLVFVRRASAIPRRDSTGMYRLRMPNVLVARDSERVDTLGTTVMDWLTGDQQVIVPPFYRSSIAGANARIIAVADPDAYGLEIWDIATARVTRALRLREQPPPLSPASYDSALADLVDREVRSQMGGDDPNPELHAKLERLASHLERYETVPSYNGILIDDAGFIWARRWAPAGAALHQYDVFGDDGRPAGRLTSHSGLSFLHVGRDFILARTRDDLGVEYVQLFSLKREPEVSDAS